MAGFLQRAESKMLTLTSYAEVCSRKTSGQFLQGKLPMNLRSLRSLCRAGRRLSG